MTHEEYIAIQRCRVVEYARKLLSRELDVLEAALAIHALGAEIGVPEGDEDLKAFLLVSSEVEALPIGAQRALWSEEALLRKEPELVRARVWAYNTVKEEAMSLIRRLAAV